MVTEYKVIKNIYIILAHSILLFNFKVLYINLCILSIFINFSYHLARSAWLNHVSKRVNVKIFIAQPLNIKYIGHLFGFTRLLLTRTSTVNDQF